VNTKIADSRGATGDEAYPLEEADQPKAKPSCTPHRILIVDDVRLLGKSIQRSLRPAGYEGLFTDNGWRALDLVAKDDFVLVITDLMMPIMSGEELVKRLHHIAPNLRCIVVTGHATRERVLRLREAPNVADVLIKPWEPKRLFAAISSVTGEGGRTAP